jgi:hypothetical protein
MSLDENPFVTIYSNRSTICPLCASQPGAAIGGQHFDLGLNHLATMHGYVLVHIGTEIDAHGYHGPAGDTRTIAVLADRDHARYLIRNDVTIASQP